MNTLASKKNKILHLWPYNAQGLRSQITNNKIHGFILSPQLIAKDIWFLTNVEGTKCLKNKTYTQQTMTWLMFFLKPQTQKDKEKKERNTNKNMYKNKRTKTKCKRK